MSDARSRGFAQRTQRSAAAAQRRAKEAGPKANGQGTKEDTHGHEGRHTELDWRYVGNQIVDAIDPSGLVERNWPPPPEPWGGVPRRWPCAYPQDPYIGVPPPFAPPFGMRPPLDLWGLPTGIGQWTPGQFHLYSAIAPYLTDYGCGGLFAMRAGLAPNRPQLWPGIEGTMVFITLKDAESHLKTLGGKGLIGAVEIDVPWRLQGQVPLPKPEEMQAGLPPQAFDGNLLDGAANYATLQGTPTNWYWEDAEGGWVRPPYGKVIHSQGPRRTNTIYVVMPGTPTVSPMISPMPDDL